MKKIAMFAAGVLFGTAGLKILGSKDAMKSVTTVRENAEDVYAEAKAINQRRDQEAADAVVEDASAEEAKAE